MAVAHQQDCIPQVNVLLDHPQYRKAFQKTPYDSAQTTGSVHTEATPSPSVPEKPAAPVLEWKYVYVTAKDGTTKRDLYSMRTTCRRYACCKVSFRGVTTYELWRNNRDFYGQIARGLESFEKAKTLAEQDVKVRLRP
jgi:hypothetical protein